MFDIGQKVMCIKNWFGDCPPGHWFQRKVCPNLPQVCGIYHIRYCKKGQSGEWTIRLVEVVNPLNHHGHEPVFCGKNFVPIYPSAEIGADSNEELV